MSTATIHIKKEKVLVPALRFEEFEGTWVTNKFSKYIKLYRGSSPRPIVKYVTTADDGVNWIKIGDTKNSKNYRISEVSEKITKEGSLKSRYVEKGEVILANSMSFGKSYLLEIEGCIYDGWFVLREFDGSFDKEFLLQVLNSEYLQRQYIRLSAGGVVQNISSDIVYSTILFRPTLPEQQKIASFLSAVDEKLQQLSKKKELLEYYKKGVMQQLFSGQLRFKDENGNPYPYWEEKRLGEVGNIVSGLTYSPDDIDESGVLVLRSSNVHGRQVTFDDNVYVNVIDGKCNPVEENDVLICVRNGSKRLIGKNALIKGKAIGVAFGAFMTVYRSASNLFLFHYFDTVDYKKEVHKNLGATINSINGSDLKKFKIPFPCEEEQQKIARYLSSIDTKIESVNNGITLTQTFKKGLLQQLFV